MQNKEKLRLPNGKLRELSELHGVHYMKAARLRSGIINPSQPEDYAFLGAVKKFAEELEAAKKNFETAS